MNIFIICRGGFGNRFNSLISGAYLARLYGFVPHVVWPVENGCMATYSDLFSQTLDEESLEFVQGIEDKCLNLKHTDWTPGKTQGISIKTLAELEPLNQLLVNNRSDIVFSTDLIPTFFDCGILSVVLSKICFSKNIEEESQQFISGMLPPSYIGLHVRRTDYRYGASADSSISEFIIANKDITFFVCSDSQSHEEYFSVHQNVVTRHKVSYVEKLVDGDWRTDKLLPDGTPLVFNVLRSRQSVIDAVIDLVILSYASRVVLTSNSTFLSTARLLNKCRSKELNFGTILSETMSS